MSGAECFIAPVIVVLFVLFAIALALLGHRMFKRRRWPPSPVVPPEPSLGACPCCAREMRDNVVACWVCKTAHHKRCWDARGMCAAPRCLGKGFVLLVPPAPEGSSAPPPEEVKVIEVTGVVADVPGGGLCQICGHEMTTGVVLCTACRTPHHKSCWDYLGRCSTYACKSKRYEVGARRRETELVIRDDGPSAGPASPNLVREWMDRLTQADCGGAVERHSRSHGHYAASFTRKGIPCALESVRIMNDWVLTFRAWLRSEQAARARAWPVPRHLELGIEPNGAVTVRSTVLLEREETVRSFFEACLAAVDAAAG